jgi:hypothetical protein
MTTFTKPENLFDSVDFQGFVVGEDDAVTTVLYRGQVPDFKRNKKQVVKFDFDLHCLTAKHWFLAIELSTSDLLFKEVESCPVELPNEFKDSVVLHPVNGKVGVWVAPMSPTDVSGWQKAMETTATEVKASGSVKFRGLHNLFNRLSHVTPKTGVVGGAKFPTWRD